MSMATSMDDKIRSERGEGASRYTVHYLEYSENALSCHVSTYQTSFHLEGLDFDDPQGFVQKFFLLLCWCHVGAGRLFELIKTNPEE